MRVAGGRFYIVGAAQPQKGISMAIQYFVDESKRVCVAKLVFEGGCEADDDAIEFIMGKLTNVLNNSSSNKERYCLCGYRAVVAGVVRDRPAPQLVGKAECSPRDTFDPDVGCELAKARLLRKYYKWLTDCAEAVEYQLETMAKLAQQASAKSWRCMRRWDDEVLELE